MKGISGGERMGASMHMYCVFHQLNRLEFIYLLLLVF